VVDYTGTLKTLTVNGATPAFTADDDTDFNIDGRLGNDTLSIAVPNSGQTTLWRSRLGSSKGDTEFVSIENIDLSGTDNEVVSVEFAAGFRNVVSVGDQQYVLTSSDGSATVTGSAIDFTSFFTDDDNGTLAFIEARTSPGTVLAGFNEILFVGTESLSYPAVPIQIIGGSIGSVVEIFDSSGDDQLTIDDGQVTLTSALGGQISATEFSEFIVTATDGNDTGSFRVSEDTPYSEIQVQSDGLVFKSSTGDVRTRGLDTIYTFEDNLLPLIRGTSDDDTGNAYVVVFAS